MKFRISNLKRVKYTIAASLLTMGLGTYTYGNPQYNLPKSPEVVRQYNEISRTEIRPLFSMRSLEAIIESGMDLND